MAEEQKTRPTLKTESQVPSVPTQSKPTTYLPPYAYSQKQAYPYYNYPYCYYNYGYPYPNYQYQGKDYYAPKDSKQHPYKKSINYPKRPSERKCNHLIRYVCNKFLLFP